MQPAAIVLDGQQRSALATVRSLGRRGVPVIVAEARDRSLAAASRYCTSALIYPDPSQSQDEFLDWLRGLDSSHPGAVLLPMTDLTVPLVLRALPDMPRIHTVLPSPSAYASASDKYQLYQLATSQGVLVPQTQVVSRRTIDELRGDEFTYPVVLKPRTSVRRRPQGTVMQSVSYAHDAAELMRRLDAQLIVDDDQCLLQEHVSGSGAGVFAIYDLGQPLFFFAHRRIREKPPSGGVSVLCESCPLPEERVTAVRRLFDSLHWHGVAMAEFKIDAAGRAWLMEINARFWGSLQLAVDSGADFPSWLYSLAIGQQPKVPPGYQLGRRLRWWLGDLDNLFGQLRDTRYTPRLYDKVRAIAAFAVPWTPGTRHEFLRASDPGPALHAWGTYVAGRLRRR
jgi:predicted ATP-grasp superfamily ATP-dependent carboligase